MNWALTAEKEYDLEAAADEVAPSGRYNFLVEAGPWFNGWNLGRKRISCWVSDGRNDCSWGFHSDRQGRDGVMGMDYNL